MESSVVIKGLNSLTGLNQHMLAGSYQTIFGSKPWGEWKKCSICQKIWGIEDSAEIDALEHRHCDHPLEDYWETGGLLKMFAENSVKDGFSSAIAFDGENVVGFCWGYGVALSDLAEKLALPGVEEKIASLGADFPMAYLSDIAVNAEYRGSGIAKKLITLFVEQQKNSGVQSFITRTKGGSEPSVTNKWFDRLGFELFMSYDDERARVVQFAKANQLAI